MASNVTDELSPRARQIVTAARELLEQGGVQALSMRHLADRLGIRASSIYKHFQNKEALEAVLISIGFQEQAALFETALEASGKRLTAIVEGYRAWAHSNPQLYRLINDGPINRSLLFPGSEDSVVTPVVRAAGGDRDLARAAWAFAHGMTALELNRRFPDDADLEAVWERGVTALEPSARQANNRTSESKPT